MPKYQGIITQLEENSIQLLRLDTETKTSSGPRYLVKAEILRSWPYDHDYNQHVPSAYVSDRILDIGFDLDNQSFIGQISALLPINSSVTCVNIIHGDDQNSRSNKISSGLILLLNSLINSKNISFLHITFNAYHNIHSKGYCPADSGNATGGEITNYHYTNRTADAQEIEPLIVSNPYLKKIEITIAEYYPGRIELAKTFLNIIGHHQTLEEVSLNDSIVSSPDNLVELLSTNQTIKKIIFTPLLISDEYLIALADTLATHLSLTSVSFRGNTKIGDPGIEALSEALKKNTILEELDLSSIKINLQGATALSTMLAVNTTLTRLHLQSANTYGTAGIEDGGVEALSEALKKNTTLEELDLSNVRISTQAATALSAMLAVNTTLTRLHLQSANIDDTGMEILASGLEKNKGLKYIDLTGNRLTSQGAEALGRILLKNRTFVFGKTLLINDKDRLLVVPSILEGLCNQIDELEGIMRLFAPSAFSLQKKPALKSLNFTTAPTENLDSAVPSATPVSTSPAVTVPNDYYCPIAQEIIFDPVVAADGFTYEREIIEAHLKTSNKSPMTNALLPHTHVVPNNSMRSTIRAFLDQYPHLWEEEVYFSKSLQNEANQACCGTDASLLKQILERDRRLLTRPILFAKPILHGLCYQPNNISSALLPTIIELIKPAEWHQLMTYMPLTGWFCALAATNNPNIFQCFLEQVQKNLAFKIEPSELAFYALEQQDQPLFRLSTTLLGDINQVIDNKGNTFLHLMAQQGNTEMVNYLIEQGADIKQRNSDGLKPEALARVAGHKKTAESIAVQKIAPLLQSLGIMSEIQQLRALVNQQSQEISQLKHRFLGL
jgi:arsenate reductase-like glutaredoxin family protein